MALDHCKAAALRGTGTKRERGLTVQGEGSQAQLRPEVQPREAREGSTGGRVLNCPSRRVRMSKRQ